MGGGGGLYAVIGEVLYFCYICSLLTQTRTDLNACNLAQKNAKI